MKFLFYFPYLHRQRLLFSNYCCIVQLDQAFKFWSYLFYPLCLFFLLSQLVTTLCEHLKIFHPAGRAMSSPCGSICSYLMYFGTISLCACNSQLLNLPDVLNLYQHEVTLLNPSNAFCFKIYLIS